MIATLQTPVKLREQGSPGRVSTQEAALLRLREKALKGDAPVARPIAGAGKALQQPIDSTPGVDAMISAEDQAILAAYGEDILARVVSSIVTELNDIKQSGSNNNG